MSATSFCTPLGSVAGVALDTETTGLDANSARLLQIGAVRLSGAAVEGGESFVRMVNPGVAIPKSAIAVHGITDAEVAGAPPFGDVIGELEAFVGPAILIGHTLSYDMAILKREYALAGRVWRPPRLLDIRILAEIAVPTLAQFDLDSLCEWLGIPIEGRHTALGDALAAAHAYVALVPRLRARGIRTLAEAEAASRRLAEGQARAAGALPAVEPSALEDAGPVLARIDSYPYRHRVREVMSAPPVTVDAGATLDAALRLMLEKRVSSVYARDSTGTWGIVTERDLLRRLGAAGSAAMQETVGSVMSKPLQTIDEQAFVYRAIGRIQRLGVRHLGVRNGAGEIVGALTTRDLLRNRASLGVVLGDEIDAGEDTVALGRAWARLPLLARDLTAEEVDARTIAAIISSEIRILTRRAAQLAEQHMAAQGKGPPPVPYAVLVLGSGGRGESLLAADQDNAIVYAEGEHGSEIDTWFAELGAHMAATLDAVGVVYCKGGVMAKNPEWRMSLAAWRSTIDAWVRRKRPQDLLNVDIFFDGITVHGDVALGDAAWSHAWDAGHLSADFVKVLGELVRDWHSPLTLFGGIRRDEKGRTDLKKGGLLPIFTAARTLAIRHGVRARSTPERLNGVLAKAGGSESDFAAVIEAHRIILGAILRQQLEDTEAGIPLSSRVNVRRSSKSEQAELRHALSRVSTVIGILREGRI